METASPDRLSSLPLETLYELFSCVEAGAPLDFRWPSHDPKWWVLNIEEGDQPLQVAMMHYQVEAVEWMLGQGVNPYEKDDNGKRRTLELICESRLLKGHYEKKLQVAARWRHKRLHIPDRDVLALRGRRMFDSLLRAGALLNPRLTRALQWKPDQVEAKPVEVKGYICQDPLSLLPRKILLKVLSHLSPVNGGCSLVLTSRFLYQTLILDLYRETGRQMSWLPIFVGALDGNLLTLQACLRAGAPIDHQWEGNHLRSGWRFSRRIRPLHVAVDYAQISSVRWLLDKGANPEVAPGDERSSPHLRAWFKALVPPYPDSRQVLWWRQKDFTVPHQETLKEEYRGILELLQSFTASSFNALMCL
ncbi:uncharacterized protein NECHADRAFT_84974 [Fusarium vanettenii 77-13-4]|uniref:F-box domain-containing protein n=1 Tax=Fusarium vanettenii (strain ATCC MYA-4622 / CBS 123669 / FGSC 9596 / NRRL 45880 / 77-13-4) TaxID=660122 RepID=C7YUM5_FUSV7|nr:uncharacterized protein NECHADRAFT_84974 [Fusarium vanettenii 77-13-4]EEU44831.1 hypothetical protein NECHADRAFT_84974 [Fusarium vanettenii 77-13-4]